MRVARRPDHCISLFFKRTVSAQIHFLALLMAIVGFVFLIPYAQKQGQLHLWGSIAFSSTAILVFTISSLYHFLADGYELSPQTAFYLEQLDQSAIYLFIAGTYTPFLMNAIAEPWRSLLMIAVWVMALIGIVYTLIRHRLPLWAQSRAVYTFMFVSMGWLLLVRIGEAWSRLGRVSLFCLLAGAASYSIGAVVYARQSPKLYEGFFGFHELWHLLVTAGFLFHFGMVCSFYL